MVEPHMAIAGYLRERREASRLTRSELARIAGVSEGLIQKLEQGTRPPTHTTLSALFEALNVPQMYRDYANTVLQPELTTIAIEQSAPNAAEMRFLNGLPAPSCYLTALALDLLAANEPFRQTFPGLEPGMNIIAYTLLDPRARVVLHNWEREAHILVQSFRHMAPGVTDPARIEEIKRECARSPDFERLWNTDIPPAEFDWRPMLIRPLEGGDWRAVHVRIWVGEEPHRGRWVYTLLPDPGEQAPLRP
ncbi:helix-turn-helix domain-containing protein [Nocardia sp. NPDC005978]|uniref:helix-turn-helix domain-containing protein n=1 Tax=unclassified Nocardia TaxID=2637762 RepID=UPI0033BF3599